MLIFRQAVFLHVPKTGGTWVREAVRRAGLQADDYMVDGDVHGDLSYCPCPERFTFAFVRDPRAIYVSYWRFKTTAGWDARNPFDLDCAAETFPRFVERVLHRYPGWCSRMFEAYVGPPTREIDFIGRYERLTDDLVRALRLAGEDVDEAVVRGVAPVNASPRQGADVRWPPSLRDAVARSERDAIARFGYPTR